MKYYTLEHMIHYLTRVHGISHHVYPSFEGRHLEQADIGSQDAVKVHLGVDPLCVPVTNQRTVLTFLTNQNPHPPELLQTLDDPPDNLWTEPLLGGDILTLSSKCRNKYPGEKRK